MNPDDDTRARLRRTLRARRAAEPPEARARDTARIATNLLAHPRFLRLGSLAAYLADEGEPDLGPLLDQAHRHGIGLYLPVPSGRVLRFLRWSPGAPLHPGRFGIPVPEDGEPINPADLDWVLVPLVAFTARGDRLGRGGGFYDRTFARHSPDRPPLLVGIAYAWQEMARLPRAPWDVALDAVVTPDGWRTCGKTGERESGR